MFLIIPLSLFVISAGLIFYITSKKFSYLRRLSIDHTAGVEQAPKNYKEFLMLLVPEVIGAVENINVEGHKLTILVEAEKILRRIRLWFLKMDNIANQMIHKVRVTHEETREKVEDAAEQTQKPVVIRHSGNSEDALKKEEQRLILEIAKNPKDAELYKLLGDVYMKLEQLSDAHESFVSALKLDPEMKGVQRKLELLEKIVQNGATEAR